MQHPGKMLNIHVGWTEEQAWNRPAPPPQVCREQQALHNRTFRKGPWGGCKGRTGWLDSPGHVRLPLGYLFRLWFCCIQRHRGGDQRWREWGRKEGNSRWRRLHHHNGAQDPKETCGEKQGQIRQKYGNHSLFLAYLNHNFLVVKEFCYFGLTSVPYRRWSEFRFDHSEWEFTAWENYFTPIQETRFFFLSRSLRACSMFTTRHQLGLSTRKALQCFWTWCVLPQQHHLLPNRYLATTSCLSHLRNSFSLRPACSVGGLRRVKASKKSGKKVDAVFPAILYWAISRQVWATRRGPIRTVSLFFCFPP